MSRQRRRRIIKTRRTALGLALVAAISFIAGMTDAVGLLMSGDFVSFMTGNTTRAAIALQTGDIRHGLVLLGAVVVFVLGNALGVVIAQSVRRRMFAVLSSVGVLLAVASALRGPEWSLLQFYLVVLAMGLVNAAVEQVEGLPIGLTYVTGALSRLGRGIGRFLLGDRQLAWTVQLAPWGGMLAGALCGAYLSSGMQSDALWVVAVIAIATAISTLLIPATTQQRFTQKSPVAKRRDSEPVAVPPSPRV